MEWEGILFGPILSFVTAIGTDTLRKWVYRKRLIDNVLKNAIMTEIEHGIDPGDEVEAYKKDNV